MIDHVPMDTAVIVALITSFASISVAAAGLVLAQRQTARSQALQREVQERQAQAQHELEQTRHELGLAARVVERDVQSKAALDRIREPLLLAASELGNRIDNIRTSGFLLYLHRDDHRRETAVRSTEFRFARYFECLERLYATFSFLRFERDEDTRAVAATLEAIGKTLATDKDPGFMLWREEQRAIGELMQRGPGTDIDRGAGYSDFVARYDDTFGAWFASFTEDLMSPGAANHPRLARLQTLLAKLVGQLDERRDLVQRDPDGRITAPGWMVRAAAG